MRLSLRPFLRGPLVLLLFSVAPACGNGGGGDEPYVEKGTTIATLNDPANPRPGENEYVDVKGAVITAVDAYDENNGGQVGNLYVQDLGEPLPYAGITVYNPGFIPPDLRVVVGDVVDIHSPYMEFAGPSSSPFNAGSTLPELSGATVKFRFESPAAPTPVQLSADQLYDYAEGRKWIGMLVEIKGATILSDAVNSNGRISASLKLTDLAGKLPIQLPSIRNSLTPLNEEELKAGNKFDVVGVVQYFYSFSVNPRSADDLKPVL